MVGKFVKFALMYRVKTPWWLPKLLPATLVWRAPDTPLPTVYLTFDDGPHPVATPFVLDQLRRHGAKATFFCIGKNVEAQPEIFEQTKAEGHAVGNHTQTHLNGWKTDEATYIRNIAAAHKSIGSHLFRPPYGRIRRAQAYMLASSEQPFKIIMWDVLSADFDTGITPQQCLDNVLKNIKPGSIVVFHDSTKAWDRMSFALPKVLEFCKAQGWACAALS
jgi:peptidoglycan/xylan/chitin deacetylase (PgdA/CDA1 family)